MRLERASMLAALAAAILSLVPPAFAERLEGFGATTAGGSGQPTYVVDSLEDSGPGTLRDAVSRSNRNVVFAVEGTIRLRTTLAVRGSFLTIDGSTAPGGGITITAASRTMKNALVQIANASDVVVRHLRFRDAPDPRTGDLLRIVGNAFNVVVDHCSFRSGGDGALDVSDGVRDVTVQWSILADTLKTQLIRSNVSRVTLHHNLYVHGWERNPSLDGVTAVDFVNNVVYDWGTNYGARAGNRSSVSFVRNVFLPGPRSDAKDAVVVTPDSLAYQEGNLLPRGARIAATLPVRLPAPAVAETSAERAFEEVLARAGALPRDPADERLVDDVRHGR